MNSNIFFQTIREWLELLNSFSGIIVAIVAIYGLQQIRIMKRDMRTRNERAAKEKAVEYASRYFSHYVPLSDKFYDEYREKGLLDYDGEIGDFTIESIKPKHLPNALERMKIYSVVTALNELQSVACVFTTGVADEKIGFSIIGRTFCGTVEDLYDVLSCMRIGGNVYPYFQNVVDLYKTWSPRLAKAELEQKRNDMTKRISAIPDREIPSIGSDSK